VDARRARRPRRFAACRSHDDAFPDDAAESPLDVVDLETPIRAVADVELGLATAPVDGDTVRTAESSGTFLAGECPL